MLKYEIVPERDTLRDQPRADGRDHDETWYALCDEDDAEVWAVYDMRGPDPQGEWLMDFDSRAAAELFCSVHFAD
jgi:hypothetical protein